MAADAAYAQKKKQDKKDEQINYIKRKHGEMMMREKVHHQKYLDCVQKQKEQVQTISQTAVKMANIENDNNLMWKEIRNINERALPESNSLLAGLSVADRYSFKTEATVKYGYAEGRHTPPKNLERAKNYKGPEIKGLMPRYVAEQMGYSDQLQQ